MTISPAAGFGDDGGMTGRRPDLRLKTKCRDILGKMIGRRLAISGKGRIGRDRFDPQQGKQALEAVIEIGIDAVEDRLKLRRVGHFLYSLGWRVLLYVSGFSSLAVGDKELTVPSKGGCRICQTNAAAIIAVTAGVLR